MLVVGEKWAKSGDLERFSAILAALPPPVVDLNSQMFKPVISIHEGLVCTKVGALKLLPGSRYLPYKVRL
jgi:hypothetical protein